METTPRVHPSSLAPNSSILPQDASVWCLQGDKLALLCHKELLPRLGLQPPLQPMHGARPRCIELQRGRLADVSPLSFVLPRRRERDGHVAGSASQRCVVARTGAQPARLHCIKRDLLQSPRAVIAASSHSSTVRGLGSPVMNARKVPVMKAGKSAGKHDSGCSSRTSHHTNRCGASRARNFHAHARHGHVYPPPPPERSPHGLARLGANCRRVHLLGC